MKAIDRVKLMWEQAPWLHLPSTDRTGELCSNRELKRWFERGAIIMNGEVVSAEDLVPHLESLVLFPNGKRKVSLL